MFIRNSKFRHVFGLSSKRDQCYEGFRMARTSHDPSLCAVNPLFVAVAVESSGGGAFTVIPLKRKGRVSTGHPRVSGHSGPITDLKWSQFELCVIASSSEDCTVRIWRLPPDGLHLDLNRCWRELKGHGKRVTHIDWHPTAIDILLSAGADLKCIIWDVSTASKLRSLALHPDLVLSVSWNRTGSLFASTCRDRRIRIIDPRNGIIVAEGEGHEGSKSSRVVFLKDRDWVFTTGFSRGSQRQMALWDANNLSRPMRIEDVDSSSGLLIPFFDPDTNIMYLAGKGDGNIRYYEITDQHPHIVYLNQYQSNSPQCGLGMMPKWGIDPYKCELARFYKLHTTKDFCEPISMIAPRKSERFQEDIFPPTSAPQPALGATEWLQGRNAEPRKISMTEVGKYVMAMIQAANEHTEGHEQAQHQDYVDFGKQLDVPSANHNEILTKSGDEDEESFQFGMVKTHIGKFEQTKQSQPAIADEEDGSELKTSSYHLKMSTSHDHQPALVPATVKPDDDDVFNGYSPDKSNEQATRINRQTSQATSGRTLTLWQSTNRPQAADSSTVRVGFEENQVSSHAANGIHPQLPSHERSKPTQIGRFKSEPGAANRRMHSTSDVRDQWPDSFDDDDEDDEDMKNGNEDGIIHFISTDAPDDTLIKPSHLRSSMRSRQKSRGDVNDSVSSSHMYRRATSLREPRKKQNLNRSGSSVRKSIGPGVTSTTTWNQKDWKPVQESTTNRIHETTNQRHAEHSESAVTPKPFNGVRSGSQSNVQEDWTLEDADDEIANQLRFRNTGIDRWISWYAKMMGVPPSESEKIVLKSMAPRSQENVVLTTSDVTVTSKKSDGFAATTNGSVTFRHEGNEDSRENEDMNKKYAMKYAERTRGNGVNSSRETGTRKHDTPPPAEYNELLSLFLHQRQEIGRLQEELLTRDRTIQRLEKQLSSVLRQSITVPTSRGTYG